MIKNNNHTNLLLVLFFIIFIGAFLMYSASSSFAFYKFNKSDTYFLYKHILWLSIGLIALFIISNINYIKDIKNEELESALLKAEAFVYENPDIANGWNYAGFASRKLKKYD